MKATEQKTIALFLIFLLLSRLTVPAIACCGPCYEEIDEECVWVGCDPPCGNCYTCNDECGCDYDCDPDTEFCCDDTCCYKGNCCMDDACFSGCWDWETVPEYAEVCPDCQPLLTGCEGIVEIRSSYQRWVLGSGYGWCKNPTKLETVGFLFECTEDWNPDLFEICGAIVAGICYYPCKAGFWPCAICIVSAGAACAFPNGVCTFVEDCIPGDAIQPVEKNVVDFGAENQFHWCG